MSARVSFRIKCLTQISQHVMICGSIAEFGNWNPQNGLMLVTHPDIYPTWMSQQDICVEPNTLIEFKVVICQGVDFFWETIPNRGIRLRHHRQMVITTYNTPNLTISPLQRLISNSDLQQLDIQQVRRLRVSNPFRHLDDDSDSNTDQDSDLQSKQSLRSLADSFDSIDVDSGVEYIGASDQF
ncbi:hypothetical protein pb186bvf_011055 [Paramecium bursaria]